MFLGIDVGTSSVKASFIDGVGHTRGSASAPHRTSHLAPGWVEQNAEDWWRAAVLAVRQAHRQAGMSGKIELRGIGISSQAPTVLPLDRSGRPLRPALIWMDRRAEPQSRALRTLLDEGRVVATVGNRLDPFFVAPKIRWLADHEPATLERTHTFLQINGYLVHRLTGSLTMDAQHASLLGLRNVDSQAWVPWIGDAVGADQAQFPEPVVATDVVGAVTPAAAEELGIAPGVAVVAGTVDSAAAALEVGTGEPGWAVEMTGSSTVVVLPHCQPRPHPAFITMASCLPDQWFSLAAMVSTGAALEWARSLLGPDERMEALIHAAMKHQVVFSDVLFLPYLMGERSPLWDSAARGVFLGLTLGTGREALVRSVLEGTSLALRHNMDVASAAGHDVRGLRSIGGPSASDPWCQMRSDATGLPVERVSTAAGATFGDAALAMVGTGHVAALADVSGTAVAFDKTFRPDPLAKPAWDRRYALFRDTYRALTAQFDSMATPSNQENS